MINDLVRHDSRTVLSSSLTSSGEEEDVKASDLTESMVLLC